MVAADLAPAGGKNGCFTLSFRMGCFNCLTVSSLILCSHWFFCVLLWNFSRHVTLFWFCCYGFCSSRFPCCSLPLVCSARLVELQLISHLERLHFDLRFDVYFVFPLRLGRTTLLIFLFQSNSPFAPTWRLFVCWMKSLNEIVGCCGCNFFVVAPTWRLFKRLRFDFGLCFCSLVFFRLINLWWVSR